MHVTHVIHPGAGAYAVDAASMAGARACVATSAQRSSAQDRNTAVGAPLLNELLNELLTDHPPKHLSIAHCCICSGFAAVSFQSFF